MTRIPILLYHSVSLAPPPVIAPFAVTPQDFERQLDLVASGGFSVLTVSAFAEALTGREPLPPRPLLITFDDGFADFYDTALPALRERALRATLYVPTALLRGSPLLAAPFGPRHHDGGAGGHLAGHPARERRSIGRSD